MGCGIKVECKNCSYNKEFFLVIGMRYWDLKGILDSCIKSKKERDIIKNILDKEENIYSNYEHSLYKCEKCGEIYERFYIKIIYDGGVYEMKHKCSECKKDLTLIGDKLNVDEVNCPQCGKKTLTENEFMVWD